MITPALWQLTSLFAQSASVADANSLTEIVVEALTLETTKLKVFVNLLDSVSIFYVAYVWHLRLNSLM